MIKDNKISAEYSDIESAIRLTRLDKTNACFALTENGFLVLNADLGEGRRDYGRVKLHRAFPFTRLDEYISVLTPEDEDELGVILSLGDLDEGSAAACKKELERKYFVPKLRKIRSIKSKFGYTYWECDTDCGVMSFTVADTFKNVVKISEIRLLVIDADGARYEIPDINLLDSRSRRKLEIYL